MTATEGDPAAATLLRLFTEIGIIDQLATAALTKLLAPALNAGEYGLLQHFALRGDGQTPSELARAMQVTRPSMTAMLAKLASKGLVLVSPDDHDGRRLRVHVTDAGRAAHAKAAARVAAMAMTATEGLDRDALTALIAPLAQLRAQLDALRD